MRAGSGCAAQLSNSLARASAPDQAAFEMAKTRMSGPPNLHSLLSRADQAVYRAKPIDPDRTCAEVPHSSDE